MAPAPRWHPAQQWRAHVQRGSVSSRRCSPPRSPSSRSARWSCARAGWTPATGSTRRSPSGSRRTTSSTSRACCARTARRRCTTCCCTSGWAPSAAARRRRARSRWSSPRSSVPVVVVGRRRAVRAAHGGRSPRRARRAARSSPTTPRKRACTRWSSLLSLLAAASFVLAFLHGRRRHVALLGLWLALLLYTQPGGCSSSPAWPWRGCACGDERRVSGRDGLLLAGAPGARLLPWLPNLSPRPRTPARRGLSGRRHSPCSACPAGCSATSALPLLALAVYWRARRRARDRRACACSSAIAIVPPAAPGCPRRSSRPGRRATSPSLFGPVLLALAAAVSRRRRAGRPRRSPASPASG